MLCRIALFKRYWWLTTTCCNWGQSPNLREATKAKLRRSKEKKGGMEADLQDWRQTFSGGVPEQLLFQLFFANPVFLNRLLVFFLKPTEVLNLPCSSCSCLLTGCLQFIIMWAWTPKRHISPDWESSVVAVTWSLASYTVASFPSISLGRLLLFWWVSGVISPQLLQ